MTYWTDEKCRAHTHKKKLSNFGAEKHKWNVSGSRMLLLLRRTSPSIVNHLATIWTICFGYCWQIVFFFSIWFNCVRNWKDLRYSLSDVISCPFVCAGKLHLRFVYRALGFALALPPWVPKESFAAKLSSLRKCFSVLSFFSFLH